MESSPKKLYELTDIHYDLFQVGLFAGAFLVLFIAVILSAVFHKQRPENTNNSQENTINA